MQISTKTLSPDEWLDALVNRKYSFRFTAYGHIKEGTQFNIGPRIIPDHHFSYYSNQETRCYINGEEHVLKQPDVLWLQPGTLHHFSPQSQNAYHSIFWLRFFLGENETAFILSQPFLKTKELHGIPGMFNDILPLVALPGNSEIFRARCLLANILSYTLSTFEDENVKTNGLTERQRRHTLEFINKNLRNRSTTEDIAHAIGLSADYFSRRFTHSFHMAVQTFIKRERIKFAGQILLESDRSVSETAEFLGYPDIYYFSHQFKEVTGQSPRSWRESKRIPRK